MNKQETMKALTLLAGNYQQIANKDKEEKMIMIETWYECLKDLDYEAVMEAIRKTIQTSSYIPTITEIRKNAIEITNPIKQEAPIELWNRAWKLIENSSIITDEDFEKEPIEIKRFFGNKSTIFRYGHQENLNVDVLRSNFISQCNLIQSQEKEKQLLPQETQQKLGNLTEKFLN